MIIGQLSNLSFVEFSASLLPVAVVGLAIEYAVLRFGFRKMLDSAQIAPSEAGIRPMNRRLTAITLGTLVLVFVG